MRELEGGIIPERLLSQHYLLTYRDSTLTGLWRLPLDGAPPAPLMSLRGERLLSFSYSPDGRRLAYAGGPNLSDVILITRFN